MEYGNIAVDRDSSDVTETRAAAAEQKYESAGKKEKKFFIDLIGRCKKKGHILRDPVGSEAHVPFGLL